MASLGVERSGLGCSIPAVASKIRSHPEKFSAASAKGCNLNHGLQRGGALSGESISEHQEHPEFTSISPETQAEIGNSGHKGITLNLYLCRKLPGNSNTVISDFKRGNILK